MAKKDISEMKIEMHKISDIQLDPNNPRTITEEDFQELVTSLQRSPRLLWLNPIIIDKKGVVKVGNQRLKASQHLGWEEIPCIKADNFTPQELKELMIKENLHAGTWDFTVLEDNFGFDKLEKWGMKDLPKKFGPTLDPQTDTSEVTEDDIMKAETSEKTFTRTESIKMTICPSCGEEFETRI